MKYVLKVVSEVEKNHTEMNFEKYETEGGRMYAVSNSYRCPVNSLMKYVSKLKSVMFMVIPDASSKL